MGFYEQISKYYDYIFPTGRAQIEFIKDSAGLPPKSILDIACGSGGYSIELAKAGYDLTAIDLDGKMIEMAKQKALKEGVHINAFQSDMRDLKKCGDGSPASFDSVFCIGNSLVHLGSLEDISEALSQMKSLLKRSGVLLLQIINYDRIINQKVNELPTIKNDEVGLEFIRNYEYLEQKGKINFNTILNISGKNGEERYENSIELLPVLSRDLEKLLKNNGFEEIELYGDFNCTPYGEKSYMLVIRARS